MLDRNKNSVFVKFRNLSYILIALSPIIWLFFLIIRWPIYNSLLDKYGLTKQATIINEKSILGKGIITQMYSYSYQFVEKGKLYTNDSKKSGYHVGEKIFIEYLESYPDINRIKK